MVLLDCVEVVAEVDHEANRVADACCGEIGSWVELFEDGAVSEMETGDRIKRGTVAALRLQEEPGAQQVDQLGVAVGSIGIGQPGLVRNQANEFGSGVVARSGLLFDPRRELGDGRQGHERGQPRMVSCEISGYLLDEEMPERHATQTSLTVGDRIEDGGVGLLGGERLAFASEHAGDAVGDAASQGDFDEDERFVRHGGVQEGVTPAIRWFEAAPQLVPVADLVYGLVVDDALKHSG